MTNSKVAVMTAQQPPTPPPGNAELQYGLHHLVQHNNNIPYRYEGDEGQYVHSGQQSSTYSSPAPPHMTDLAVHHPEQYLPQHYGASPFSDMRGSPEMGIPVHYDQYAEPGSTYYDHNGYPVSYVQGTPNGLTQGPPTPRSVGNSDSGRRTRSGQTIAATSSPKPRARAAKQKKTKSGKDKPDVPKLTAPLSELTKDYHHIPIKDMEEYVNRSAETRRADVNSNRKGYVPRPMNSFMLYRSAFAERTKHWCLQNNHQVVSSVSGESWPLEPPEVREKYNELARIERINHQNAHPSYKFQPSKAGINNRKRKGTTSEDEDDDREPSDLDDDPEWGTTHRRKTPRNRRHAKEVGYPSHSPIETSHININGMMNRSSWEATNEGRPLPASLGQHDLYNQYYQTSIHSLVPGIEDLRMRKMDMPGHVYAHSMQQHHQPAPHQSLLGLPGGPAHDLLAMHPHTGTPVGGEQVDPMLLAFDHGPSMLEQPALHFESGVPMFSTTEQSHQHHPVMPIEHHQPVQEYHPEPWQVDTSVGRLETGSEFDKWMDDENAHN